MNIVKWIIGIALILIALMTGIAIWAANQGGSVDPKAVPAGSWWNWVIPIAVGLVVLIIALIIGSHFGQNQQPQGQNPAGPPVANNAPAAQPAAGAAAGAAGATQPDAKKDEKKDDKKKDGCIVKLIPWSIIGCLGIFLILAATMIVGIIAAASVTVGDHKKKVEEQWRKEQERGAVATTVPEKESIPFKILAGQTIRVDVARSYKTTVEVFVNEGDEWKKHPSEIIDTVYVSNKGERTPIRIGLRDATRGLFPNPTVAVEIHSNVTVDGQVNIYPVK